MTAASELVMLMKTERRVLLDRHSMAGIPKADLPNCRYGWG